MVGSSSAMGVSFAVRTARAACLAAGWLFAAAPAAMGWQRCAFAMLFHRPCPGCGMTRAVRLLQSGQVEASLRMHPLAVPVLVTAVMLALSTVLSTFTEGTPYSFYRSPLGRASLALAAVVHVAAVALWLARALGFFGGPVPV